MFAYSTRKSESKIVFWEDFVYADTMMASKTYVSTYKFLRIASINN